MAKTVIKSYFIYFMQKIIKIIRPNLYVASKDRLVKIFAIDIDLINQK